MFHDSVIQISNSSNSFNQGFIGTVYTIDAPQGPASTADETE
jgi:hypothetical protein